MVRERPSHDGCQSKGEELLPKGCLKNWAGEGAHLGGESKKESLGVSRVQLKVQLGRTTGAGGTVRVPGSAREKGLEYQAKGPDLLWVVVEPLGA